MMLLSITFCLFAGFCGLGYFTPWLRRKYLVWRSGRPAKLRAISSMSKVDQAKYEDFKVKHKAVLIKWLREHGENEPPPILRDPITGEFHWAPRKLRRSLEKEIFKT